MVSPKHLFYIFLKQDYALILCQVVWMVGSVVMLNASGVKSSERKLGRDVISEY